jgi:hypothetical protein
MKPVTLIGAPTDVGASIRGASMGPEALRVADIAGALVRNGLDVTDLGNLVGPATRTCHPPMVFGTCRRLSPGTVWSWTPHTRPWPPASCHC